MATNEDISNWRTIGGAGLNWNYISALRDLCDSLLSRVDKARADAVNEYKGYLDTKIELKKNFYEQVYPDKRMRICVSEILSVLEELRTKEAKR